MPGEMIERMRRAARMPPHVAAGKALRRLRRAVGQRMQRRRDRREGTFLAAGARGTLPLARFYRAPAPETLAALASPLLTVVRRYREHRFDLLGSGWVPVGHGAACPGLEGIVFPRGAPVHPDPEGAWLVGRINGSNLAEARARWRLLEGEHEPIDWQLDFRSGHRWDEAVWHGDIRFGHRRGADIKVPWELARLQHLPRLAWAHGLARQGRPGFEAPEAYAREFRNVALDFLATNPPGFGVNWQCTMDVAIRAVNLLVGFDLFRALGTIWDAPFEDVLARGAMEHAAFIAGHLEYDPALRGNHYLANIAGLLLTAAYLPPSRSADGWLAFAIRELVREVELQFHPDGSNFEASTAYHRLSAEMACHATALVLALPRERTAALERIAWTPAVGPALRAGEIRWRPVPGRDGMASPFPASYWERLAGMTAFLRVLVKRDGRMPQIGDNDSGRFLRLTPAPFLTAGGEEPGPEDSLSPGHLLGSLHGLLGGAAPPPGGAAEVLEAEVVRSLVDGRGPALPPSRASLAAGPRDPGALDELLRSAAAVPPRQRRVFEFPLPAGAPPEDAEAHAFPDFGLYVLRSGVFHLTLRCGSVGQAGVGGHAHNDQLAVELQIDGRDVIVDPGTYVYTPLPERRNAYRSVRAHFTPRIGEAEPASLADGLFRLADTPGAECLHVSPRGLAARHAGFGSAVYRIVEVRDGCLRIVDWAPERPLLPPEPDPPTVSPGYGILSERRPWPAELRFGDGTPPVEGPGAPRRGSGS